MQLKVQLFTHVQAVVNKIKDILDEMVEKSQFFARETLACRQVEKVIELFWELTIRIQVGLKDLRGKSPYVIYYSFFFLSFLLQSKLLRENDMNRDSFYSMTWNGPNGDLVAYEKKRWKRRHLIK